MSLLLRNSFEENMNLTISEYLELKSDALPYITKWGASIKKIDVVCPLCNQSTSDIKLKFSEFSSSVNILATGLCYNCHTVITNSALRIYKDGRISWINDQGQWQTSFPSPWKHLLKLSTWIILFKQMFNSLKNFFSI